MASSFFTPSPRLYFTSNPPPLLFKTQKWCLHLQCLSARKLQHPISSTDYLVRSLRLTKKSVSKSKHIELKSTSNADSVLSLFRNYGFNNTQMATIFSARPRLLHFHAHRHLKPKLDFFAQNGISGDALVAIITNEPYILSKTLSTIIAPCFDFLIAFFGTESNQSIVSLFSPYRGASILRHFSGATAPNVEALRRLGVPDENIAKLFLKRAQLLTLDVDKFIELVNDVREAGFDPESMMFVLALWNFKSVKKEKRVSQMGLLKEGFGWSDEQVRELILKQPSFLRQSEKRLKEGLELFMNRLEWTPEYIIMYPSVLFFSLEERIFPRLSVVQILISEGLQKKTCMGWAIKASEPVFLKRFVHRYQQDIPQLLQLYQQSLINSTSL